MYLRAISQANERLQKSILALENMEGDVSFEQFERNWSDFLIATNTIYSKLEQGAKASGVSQAWYGRIKRVRKTDPLLAYLHHARNADEHCLQNTSTANGVGVKLGNANEGMTTTFTVEFYDDGYQEWSTGTSNHNNEEMDFPSHHCNFELLPIVDRGRKYSPPTEHLGHALNDLSAISIARTALAYFTALMVEAETYLHD